MTTVNYKLQYLLKCIIYIINKAKKYKISYYRVIAYNEFGISPPTATREEVGFICHGYGEILIE